MKNKKNILITAAVAGLIAGITVPHAYAGDAAAAPHADGAKDACSGKDGCNGKDDCKGKDKCNGKDATAEQHAEGHDKH